MIETILLSVTFIVLCVGTYTDFKWREVPDWLSWGFLMFAFGTRIIGSLYESNLWTLASGLIGFGIFFVIAMAMYYLHQWGGGDAKLLMGLGAAFGFEANFNAMIFIFLVDSLVGGAIFGLLFSLYLALKKRKEFVRCYIVLSKEAKYAKITLLIILIIVLVVYFFVSPFLKMAVAMFALMTIFLLYSFLFINAVEKSCLISWKKPDELTEGDWIVKPVVVKGKRIASPKDLGLEKKQIALIKRLKVKKVLVKDGMPFVPVFLLGYLLTIIFGAWLMVVF
ncbi:MAG: A24 family peptidase [Candidatus Woesearchaeota archaeon]